MEADVIMGKCLDSAGQNKVKMFHWALKQGGCAKDPADLCSCADTIYNFH